MITSFFVTATWEGTGIKYCIRRPGIYAKKADRRILQKPVVNHLRWFVETLALSQEYTKSYAVFYRIPYFCEKIKIFLLQLTAMVRYI